MTARSARRTVMLATIILALGGCASATSSPEPSGTASGPAGPSSRIEVSFTGTVPDGWSQGTDHPYPIPETENVSFEVSQDQQIMAADCQFEPEAGVGGSAEEFVGALTAREGLDVSEPASVTVGELSGLQIDFTAAADGTGATCEDDFVPLWGFSDADGLWLFVGAAPDESNRLIVLDVPGGGNLLIWMFATEPEVLADHLDAAMSVVDGLAIDVP